MVKYIQSSLSLGLSARFHRDAHLRCVPGTAGSKFRTWLKAGTRRINTYPAINTVKEIISQTFPWTHRRCVFRETATPDLHEVVFPLMIHHGYSF